VRVLGIETATDICSVALAAEGTVVHEIAAGTPRAHAEMLMQQITGILERQGWGMTDLDGLAVSIGPGSFTGLRIGLAAAKGIAWARDIPLVAVPTLDALAFKTVNADLTRQGETLVTAVDSRKGEVYVQMYSLENGVAVPQGSVAISDPEEILSRLRGKQAVVTGPSMQLRSVLVGGGSAGIRVVEGAAASCTAGPVALLGEKRIEAGEAADRAMLEPLYVQQFQPKLRTRMV